MTDDERLDAEIEQLRERHTPPVGCWQSDEGTFEAVMGHRWSFRGGGVGESMLSGPLHYPQQRTVFQWRSVGSGELEIRELSVADFHGAGFSEPELIEDPQWEPLRYRFGVHRTEFGARASLFFSPVVGQEIAFRFVEEPDEDDDEDDGEDR